MMQANTSENRTIKEEESYQSYGNPNYLLQVDSIQLLNPLIDVPQSQEGGENINALDPNQAAEN